MDLLWTKGTLGVATVYPKACGAKYLSDSSDDKKSIFTGCNNTCVGQNSVGPCSATGAIPLLYIPEDAGTSQSTLLADIPIICQGYHTRLPCGTSRLQ